MAVSDRNGRDFSRGPLRFPPGLPGLNPNLGAYAYPRRNNLGRGGGEGGGLVAWEKVASIWGDQCFFCTGKN